MRVRIYDEELKLVKHGFAVTATLLRDALLNKVELIKEETILGIYRKHNELQFKQIGMGVSKGKPYSVQWINLVLKELKGHYNLKIKHFSTHSLRKTFGRKVFESSDNAELALVKLMELFNHSSVSITKRYLGLRQEEILETYDCLTF